MPSRPASDFNSISKEIAEEFIQTVVFVDDEAYYPEKENTEPQSLQQPRRVTKVADEKEIHSIKKRPLNAKEILSAFSEKGIICSIIKPDTSDDAIGLIISSANRADAFVLDWDINSDSGDTALEIMSELIKKDMNEDKHNPRLRVIVLYTGENDLLSIYTSIKNKLKEEGYGDFNLIDDQFAIQKGNLRISIYAKEGTALPKEYKSKEVKIKDLPDRLASDLSELTRGLISNAALFSISLLRDKTSLLLARMGRDLDAPFLAHRAMLHNPMDADKQVVEIISSEISSLLDSFNVGEKAGIDNISLWIEDADTAGFLRCPLDTEKTLDKETAIKWMKYGLDRDTNDLSRNNISEKKWKKFVNSPHKNMTSAFLSNETDNTFQSDCRFALLSSTKQIYNDMPRPILRLGTIVSITTNESKEFLLCIQPVCDSIRLNGEVVFPFLKLEVIADDDSPFDIIIEEDGNNTKAKILMKPKSLILHSFSVKNGDDRVLATKEENGSLFFLTSDQLKMKYASELKSKHAQRVVNEFAMYFSRVGLDESEWLRRWAKKK